MNLSMARPSRCAVGAVRAALGIALLAAALPLTGCGRRAEEAPAARPAPPMRSLVASALESSGPIVLYSAGDGDPGLLDGFERQGAWAVESADDPAVLASVERHATQGERALSVRYEAYGMGKFQVRLDRVLDLRNVREVLLDVTGDGGPADVALGLHEAGSGASWGSPRVSLPAGETVTAVFALPESRPAYGYLRGADDIDLSRINRLTLTFYEGPALQGEVVLDNLRLRPPPPKDAWASSVLRIEANAAAVPQYGRHELTLQVSTREKSLFERGRLDLFATYFSPSGRVREAHGFLYQPPTSDAPSVWKVRFAPDEPGRWVFDVAMRENGASVAFVSPLYGLDCRGAKGGFVRVSRDDPRFFELSDGAFFYPVGLNVAWAWDMRAYFRKLAAQGANAVRIWMCPWHMPLEPRREVGRYDLAVAERLDALLDLAEQHGLRVILVLEYHGMLAPGASWGENPYNAANGGPCARPEDFFTNAEARRLFQRRLDYIAARWAYSPAIFAWELWNEADYAWRRSFDDVVAWHREMAAHLRAVDPQGHLVTTSVGSLAAGRTLFALEEVDFVSAHLYAEDLRAETLQADEIARSLPRKPFLLAEYGARPEGNDPDGMGSRLQFTQGLWLSGTLPWAGAGMSWWWDTRVDRDDLYPCLGAAAALLRDADRRGLDLRRVEIEIPAGGGLRAAVRGLMSPGLAWFWIYDPARLADSRLAQRPLIAGAGAGFVVDGMLAGAFAVEVWDTRTGARLERRTVQCTDGRVLVALPPSRGELAVGIRALGPARPEFHPGLPSPER